MRFSERPVEKIPRYLIEIMLNILAYGILIASIILLLSQFGQLDAQIPTTKTNGVITEWAPKSRLWITPIVGLLFAIIFEIIEHFPHWHIYPPQFSKHNYQSFYRESRKTANYVKNAGLFLISFLTYTSINNAIHQTLNINIVLMIVYTLFFCALIFWRYYVMSKIK